MKIEWLDPWSVMLPHKATRPEQVHGLAASIECDGWNGPPLIGYKLGDEIQLLSGTHRTVAARMIGFDIPVVLYPYEIIEKVWGTQCWDCLMNRKITQNGDGWDCHEAKKI